VIAELARRFVFRGVSCVLAVAMTASVIAQGARDSAAPQSDTASISGVVMTAGPAPTPVRKVVLILSGTGLSFSRSVLSDDDGRFAVGSLPAGTYTLAAVKPGYVPATYGEKQPGRGPGVVLSLTAGQHQEGLSMRMTPGAVVTGRIHDEGGRPYPGIMVTVMDHRMVNGERRFAAPALGPGAQLEPRVATDDRGTYRIYGLPPGEYVVSASMPSVASSSPTADLRRATAAELQWAAAQVQSASPTAARDIAQQLASPPAVGPRVGASTVYYPGTADPATAVPLELGAGEERTGVDFAVTFVAVARVEGTVTGPDGQPLSGAQVSLVRALGPVVSSFNASSQSNGSFSIANVPPGNYQLVARGRAAPAGRGGNAAAAAVAEARGAYEERLVSAPNSMWGLQEASVAGQDLTGISLVLKPGMRLTGRVSFESRTSGTPAVQTVAATRVHLTIARGGPFSTVPPAVSRPDADGNFEITGILPGRYRLTAVGPGAWTHKSSLIGSRDVADVAFDITSTDVNGAVVTFTDRPAGVTGRLLDTAGRPAPEYFVVVFSTDRQYWQEGSRRLPAPVRPATDGRYTFSPLPAGSYYLAAVTDISGDERYDTSLLEQLAVGALTITVGEGELTLQDLKLATSSVP
jgi:protocatechuate 3,4-dioxygenase beta subunit